MRIYIFIIGLMFSQALSFAQTDGVLQYDMAIEKAKEEGKILVIQFAGSDWCSPCIRLDEQILNTTEFQEYKEGFVWLKADFPRKKNNRLSKEHQAHNDALAEKYNNKGQFPLLVFIDSNEKVLGTIGYQSVSPSEYATLIENIIIK